MFAVVKDGAIRKIGPTVEGLFPYSVPEGAGFTSISEFIKDQGVMDVVDGERKSEEYYFVTGGDVTLVDGVPTRAYTNTARRLVDEEAKDENGDNILDQDGNKIISVGLKTTMTDRIKAMTNSMLVRTDWMVIRKAERDVDIPSATATYRAAVITECARLEAAIAGAADVDALAVVMAAQNWPKEP